MDTGSEFLIEEEKEMTIVQLVNSSVAAKNKLEQKQKTSCCSRVLLSSTGQTQEWYPGILGVYSLQQGDGPPVYKMLNSEKYLYRPRRGKERRFTWGVNSSPHQTWGWVKSFLPGKCPDLMKNWAAFDPVKKKMTADPTFRVSCRQP